MQMKTSGTVRRDWAMTAVVTLGVVLSVMVVGWTLAVWLDGTDRYLRDQDCKMAVAQGWDKEQWCE